MDQLEQRRISRTLIIERSKGIKLVILEQGFFRVPLTPAEALELAEALTKAANNDEDVTIPMGVS